MKNVARALRPRRTAFATFRNPRNLTHWDGMDIKPVFRRLRLAAALLSFVSGLPLTAQTRPQSCIRLDLTGQVSAGSGWSADMGEGWVFRLVPVEGRAYTGWDLVVDREQPAGYPDVLLLATPPWNSINEREIATTFGLRAQDALGWNPRSFHFLVDPANFEKGRQVFDELNRAEKQGSSGARRVAALTQELMAFDAHAAAGQFRILDARLVPGTADAAPFAENWAIAGERMQHTDEPAAGGPSTPRGEFHWIKFAITLWLPAQWKAPKGVQVTKSPCG